MNFLEKLADPELIEQMTTGQKTVAALETTVMGVVITFAALIIIWGLLIVLNKVVTKIEQSEEDKKKIIKDKEKNVSEKKQIQEVEIEDENENDDEELIAVITAAVASHMGKSTSTIVVKNIVRVNDDTPTWGKVGRINQLKSNL
ncbi:MAG: OadG family protein [Bacillota bacterium]